MLGRGLIRLIPETIRFVALEGLRPRRSIILATGVAVAGLESLLVVESGRGAAVTGSFMLLGLLIVTSPLCRSWVDEDVRQGYGAFWLQKPVSAPAFYLARLIAAVLLAVGLGVMNAAAVVPAMLLGSSSVGKFGGLLVIAVAIPALLVVLSFLGSSLGARNSGLFAYVLVFLGLWMGVFLGPEAVDGPTLVHLIEPLVPPVRSLLTAGRRVQEDGVTPALGSLWPVVAYVVVASGIGLIFAARAPARLSRVE